MTCSAPSIRTSFRQNKSGIRVCDQSVCYNSAEMIYLAPIKERMKYFGIISVNIDAMPYKYKPIEEIINSSVLPFVLKPGRYLGNEQNAIHKDLNQVSLRVALAFPEVYELAMSYIGFDILYHVLNKERQIWAERVYAPWTDMEARLREHRIPLHSLESFTPLNHFDIIGFTLQYELTYTNVLNMLDLSGIPLLAKDRAETDPFVLAGGPCSCNPEPMADYIDAFLIGDGEEALLEMSICILDGRNEGKSRQDILRDLAQIRSVYVPRFYEPAYDAQGRFYDIIRKEEQIPPRVLTRILPELKNEFYPHLPLMPLVEVTHDRLAVEVMRGCTEGCRYCNAGMIYRPTRERNPQDVISHMDTALKATGYEEVSFLSLSISDYSELGALMTSSRKTLEGRNINVSFPSMRLDSFTPEIAEFAASVRKSGFTFAPEAGSERLRRVINKNISVDDLYNSLRIALDNGWKHLKFYFMIGLPTETEEDVEAIADLVEEALKISRDYGRVKFNISVSPFSPKAHTPFQWEKQDTKEEFQNKVAILRKRFSRFRQVKFNWRDPDVSLIECVLGRADRRMGRVIMEAWKNGAIFDGWSEYFKIDIWRDAEQKSAQPFEVYTGEWDVNAPLPWDHIDKGVSKNFLLRDRLEAVAEKTKIDCKQGTCFACGIQRKDSFREFTDCYLQMEPPVKKDPQLDLPVVKKEPEAEVVEVQTQRVRIKYRKTKYARYLSHLDLVRLFERTANLARIPLMYSQGFNPHPKLSFGPPLALGYSSEAEYLDMEVDSAFDVQSIHKILNPLLPDGLDVLELQVIREKTTALAAAINANEYEVNLSDLKDAQQAFTYALDALLKAEKIEVERRVKGKYKQIDIRPFIETLTREDDILTIRTRSIENRTVRIREILEQLFGAEELQQRQLPVHRLKQLIRNGNTVVTPLEILT